MTAFNATRNVEARGMQLLLPYIQELSNGRYVVTNKGPLARYLQLSVGDVVYNDTREVMWAAEIKVEETRRPNLFLEIWSNRNLNERGRHAQYGSNPGWLYHSRADWLFYYFLDTDDLFVIDLFALQRWAFGFVHTDGREFDPQLFSEEFRQAGQRKYVQRNETIGRLVPIDLLQKKLKGKMKHCKVRQLSLLKDAA